MRRLSIRLFWNGIVVAHADPEWPEWFQKYHKCLFYPSRTANGIALSNQHRKVKYVNPCLEFLGIPDQRTAYVKWQARPRLTYVRRSSVTPDLIIASLWKGPVNRNSSPQKKYISEWRQGIWINLPFQIKLQEFIPSIGKCIYYTTYRRVHMMTSSNENTFSVTGPMWGEFAGQRWIPPHKVQWHGSLMFSLICAGYVPCQWGDLLDIDTLANKVLENKGNHAHKSHYSDVIISTMASQITKLTIVYSIVYSGTDQRKHRSSASLAFVTGVTGEFPAQMASNTENVSIWWRHHDWCNDDNDNVNSGDVNGDADEHNDNNN